MDVDESHARCKGDASPRYQSRDPDRRDQKRPTFDPIDEGEGGVQKTAATGDDDDREGLAIPAITPVVTRRDIGGG